MKRIAFGESVQGASHKRNETECQDSMKKVEFEDGSVVLAVADGHGSKACPFSKSGSGIAVNTAVNWISSNSKIPSISQSVIKLVPIVANLIISSPPSYILYFIVVTV